MSVIKGQKVKRGDGVQVRFSDHTQKEREHASEPGKLVFDVFGVVQRVDLRKKMIVVNTWTYADNHAADDENTSSFTIDTRTIEAVRVFSLMRESKS